MNKKNISISIIILFVIVMILIYAVYLVDSRKISISADIESDASAEELTTLPAPDQSTFSKIYTAIVDIFK